MLLSGKQWNSILEVKVWVRVRHHINVSVNGQVVIKVIWVGFVIRVRYEGQTLSLLTTTILTVPKGSISTSLGIFTDRGSKGLFKEYNPLRDPMVSTWIFSLQSPIFSSIKWRISSRWNSREIGTVHLGVFLCHK